MRRWCRRFLRAWKYCTSRLPALSKLFNKCYHLFYLLNNPEVLTPTLKSTITVHLYFLTLSKSLVKNLGTQLNWHILYCKSYVHSVKVTNMQGVRWVLRIMNFNNTICDKWCGCDYDGRLWASLVCGKEEGRIGHDVLKKIKYDTSLHRCPSLFFRVDYCVLIFM